MRLEVKVISNASQNKVLGFEGERLKVKCIAVREKGKANEAVIELLANYYKVAKSQVKILKGKTSSIKTVDIEGI